MHSGEAQPVRCGAGYGPTGKENPQKKPKPKRNAPTIDLKAELRRTCGVDLTSIDGIYVITAQTILSEVGTDMSGFPTQNHFTSWLGLTPSKDISGGNHRIGKVESAKTGLLWHSAWPPPPC
jgi:hypothetical protein